MRVAFRTDASVQIGAGHAMRCLTLARALRARGADCVFLMRDLPGHAGAVIVEAGFALTLLRSPTADERPDDDLAHAAWLGLSQAADAAECSVALAASPPAWLVVDHYALDARWERAVCPAGTRILAIDDLADRPHDASLLLDQNLGRQTADYAGLVPEACIRLIGPRFALLRSEFAAARPAALARRGPAVLHHVLVAMGGIDKDNITGRVLDALARMQPTLPARVTAVLGGRAPHLEKVRAMVGGLPFSASVEVDRRDMAGLMVRADLAIGAAGGTSWERCCLGLPALLLTLADNQRGGAEALDQAGAAILLGDVRAADWPRRLQAELARLLAAPALLAALTTRAATLVDGGGAARATAMLTRGSLTLRRAKLTDAEPVWHWRHAGGAERFFQSGRVTPLADHLAWFARALADPERLMLIVEHEGVAAGHVRFDRDGEDPSGSVISICLAERFRGQGLALAVMEAAHSYAFALGVARVEAQVHHANATSLRLFEAAGYRRASRGGDFLCYLLTVPTNPARSPTDLTGS